MIGRVLAIVMFCAGLICIAQAQLPMTGAGRAGPAAGGGACAGALDLSTGCVMQIYGRF